MNANWIEEGDTVGVEWERLEPVRGTVLYRPMNQGEDWSIRTNDGSLVLILNYSRMWMTKKGDPK